MVKRLQNLCIQELSKNQKLMDDAKARKPVVAVIDDYKDTAYIGSKAVTHGDLIETFIKQSNPYVNFIRYDVGGRTMSGKSGMIREAVLQACEDLSDRIDHGQKVDAVNISFGDDCDIKAILGDKPVIKKNLRMELIKLKFIEKGMSGGMNNIDPNLSQNLKPTAPRYWTRINDEINAIDKLARKTKVYVSAGNGGSNIINTNATSSNAISIGATNAKGEKTSFSPDKPLVDKFEQGIFNVTPIKNDKDELLGWDITGSGQIELPGPTAEEIKLNSKLNEDQYLIAPPASSIKPIDPDGSGRPAVGSIGGTSFSAPVALAKDLLNTLSQQLQTYYVSINQEKAKLSQKS